MFSIDNMSKIPVYEQLVKQIEKFILSGLLNVGDSLPSVRNLSVELSINPNTIQKSYSELTAKGITFSVPGKGLFISNEAIEIIENNRKAEIKETIKEMKLEGFSKKEILDIVVEVYK